MKNHLPFYLVSLLGIAIMGFYIGKTAQTESTEYFYLLPIGLLLCLGGALYPMLSKVKKNEK